MKEIRMSPDKIRQAVELADEFEYRKGPEGNHIHLPYIGWVVSGSKVALDALAAQLVRQVDATKDRMVLIVEGRTSITGKENNVSDDYHSGDELYYSHFPGGWAEGPDRTQNTINAILDSKVLDRGEI